MFHSNLPPLWLLQKARGYVVLGLSNSSLRVVEGYWFKPQFLVVPAVLAAFMTAVFSMQVFNYGWSWAEAIMFGAIISATDPVAVVALLKGLGELTVNEWMRARRMRWVSEWMRACVRACVSEWGRKFEILSAAKGGVNSTICLPIVCTHHMYKCTHNVCPSMVNKDSLGAG